MALFKKVITKPGVYLARKTNGERALVDNTREKIASLVETGNKMLQDGHLIPAPYAHKDADGIVPVPLFKDEEGNLKDSRTGKPLSWGHAVNGGYWTKFEVGPQGEWVGYIEADGDENDPDSHAGRISKTFRQTSPVMIDEWTDGKNRQYKNVPLHICLTNKGVEPGQANFERVKEQELALAMSFDDDDLIQAATMSSDEDASEPKDKSSFEKDSEGEDKDVDGVDDSKLKSEDSQSAVFGQIKDALQTRLGLVFPVDTDESNFMERLLTLLINLPEEEEDEGLKKTRPKEDEDSEELSPTVMSTETDNKKTTALIGAALTAKKQQLKGRVDSLVKSGRYGRKSADEKLIPQIDALAMSLDDLDDEGNMPTFPIEMALDVLEEKPSLIEKNEEEAPTDADELDAGDLDGPDGKEMTPEEVNSILDSLGPMGGSQYKVVGS